MLKAAGTNGIYSLSQISSEALIAHKIRISKQAIDSRFDKEAVMFLKELLGQVILAQIAPPTNINFFSQFNRVLIKDSTKFDLPRRLKDDFLGFGGKITSEAGISIQYEYDLKDGRLHDFDFTSSRKNDVQDAKKNVKKVKKGDLVLRDLGYFSSPVLEEFDLNGAFYLSRIKSQIEVFDETDQAISFKKLLPMIRRKKLNRMNINATIGHKKKLPVRLIVEVVPDDVYQERVRKRAQENKKRGQKMSDEFKARAHFNLFVTNVPEEDLPTEHVYDLYKLRWQIELLFKSLKSTLGINNIHPMRHDRLICLLCAKLILYLAARQITMMFMKYFYIKKGKHLSIYKSIKTLMDGFAKTRSILTLQKIKLSNHIKDLNELLSRNHWLEQRKGKKCFAELFELFSCVSKI